MAVVLWLEDSNGVINNAVCEVDMGTGKLIFNSAITVRGGQPYENISFGQSGGSQFALNTPSSFSLNSSGEGTLPDLYVPNWGSVSEDSSDEIILDIMDTNNDPFHFALKSYYNLPLPDSSQPVCVGGLMELREPVFAGSYGGDVTVNVNAGIWADILGVPYTPICTVRDTDKIVISGGNYVKAVALTDQASALRADALWMANNPNGAAFNIPVSPFKVGVYTPGVSPRRLNGQRGDSQFPVGHRRRVGPPMSFTYSKNAIDFVIDGRYALPRRIRRNR